MRITDLLRAIDLFAGLSAAELEQLASNLRDRHLERGDVLCQPDRPCNSMFIVVSGSVELVEDERARQIGTGESFGEASVISGEPLDGTAIAKTASDVLEISKDDFDAFVAARPNVMRSILASVSRRAVQANQRLLSEQPPERAVAESRVYAVFSPRGGAGKTLIATRLATKMAEQMPQRVTLMDLDLLFDDAALELDVNGSTPSGGLARQEVQHLDAGTVSSLLAEHGSSLRVLVGATTPEDGERVTAGHVRAALLALKRRFLATVVDCGSTFSEPTLAALEMSDRVLVVCTPELVTLRDVRDCQRIFGHALQLDKARVAYVLNHPSPAAGLSRRQLEDALEQRMLLELPHAGEGATKSIFSKAVDQLVRELAAPREKS